jgi:hypothetical protein
MAVDISCTDTRLARSRLAAQLARGLGSGSRTDLLTGECSNELSQRVETSCRSGMLTGTGRAAKVSSIEQNEPKLSGLGASPLWRRPQPP